MRASRAVLLALALPVVSLAARPARAATFDHEHQAWQRLLERSVHEGLVDYEALRADPEALDDYLRALAEVDSGDYTAWTPDQRLAFWLNAVNAFTVKAVVDSYPLKRPWYRLSSYKYPANSVKQERDFDSRLFTAAGQELTLREARALAVQLRPDPRLPLALTCPCLGGPPLPTQAFTPEALETQLDDAARAFLSDPRRVAVLDEKAQVLRLSEALKAPGIGDPLALLRRFSPPDRAAELQDRGWTVQWQPVDWTLDELGTREAGRGTPKTF